MQNTDIRYLMVCEEFYSIQGEGINVGIPAIFLRLSGCNLDCIGFSKGCDSKHLWTKGEKYSYQQIIKKWQQNRWLEKLQAGAHLVITGGEPLLQQEPLFLFIKQLDETPNMQPYIELETNATILLNDKLLDRISQINASPKLSTSGNSSKKAYQSDVLLQLSQLAKTKFKFVISKEQDINEILHKYIIPFNINPRNIWLMPEGHTRDDIQKKSPMIVELCKKYMMNFSPRLQIDVWNNLFGV